jgi:hypothetical protein
MPPPSRTPPPGFHWELDEEGSWVLVADASAPPATDPNPSVHAPGSTAPAPTAAAPNGYHWEEAGVVDGVSQGWQMVPNGKAFADTQKAGYIDPMVPRTPVRTYQMPTRTQVQQMVTPALGQSARSGKDVGAGRTTAGTPRKYKKGKFGLNI